MMQPEKKKKSPERRYQRRGIAIVLLMLMVGLTLFVIHRLTRPAQLAYLAPDYSRPGPEGQNSYLFLVKADGSGRSPSLGQPVIMSYDWSPDGTRVVFGSFWNGLSHGDIYMMNADGSNIVGLTENLTRVYTYHAPAWSPDGSKIGFTAIGEGNGQIWMMNADGSNPYMLMSQPSDSPPPYANWSPDSKKVAYRALDKNVYTLEVTGGEPFQVTHTDDIGYSPAWSPDGTRLLITHWYDGTGGTYEIFVINADGTNRVNLSNHPDVDENPAWSPDGRYVTFNSTRDGNYELYRVDADGTNLTRLTHTDNDEGASTWSLDGTQIAYITYKDGLVYTSIMDAAGSDMPVFIDGLGVSWRPNPCGAWDIVCYLMRP